MPEGLEMMKDMNMTESTPPTPAVKAKDCPLCGSAADKPSKSAMVKLGLVDPNSAACSNEFCHLSDRWMPLAQWNRRPREEELEAALREAGRKLEYEFHQDCLYARMEHKPEPRQSEPLQFIRKALASISEVLREGK